MPHNLKIEISSKSCELNNVKIKTILEITKFKITDDFLEINICEYLNNSLEEQPKILLLNKIEAELIGRALLLYSATKLL